MAQALVALATSDNSSGYAFNVGTGVATSINQVVEFICEYFKYNGPVQKSSTGNKSFVVPDVSAIKAATGWSAKISIQQGLAKTIEAEQGKHK